MVTMRSWRRWLQAGLVLVVAACGGGDDSGDNIDYNPLWVYVETGSLQEVTPASGVELRGKAYCESCPPPVTEFGFCPPYGGVLFSDVDVSWQNLTTGASGDAGDYITGSCSCLFSYCTTFYSHGWIEYDLPLAMGENQIVVTASYEGYTATDSVLVTRVPQAVTGLTATAGAGQIILQWDDVPEATSYTLYWSIDPAFTRETATPLSGVVSPYLHTGLTDGVTYYYLVTALSGAFEIAASPKVFATPGWPDLP